MFTIKVFISAFPRVEIPNIDPATINFYGSTEGYDHKDMKSSSTIGFVAENAHEIVEKIKATFQLNPKYSKPEDYIWVKDKFEDYKKDKRPRIGIRLKNGSRGLINPPSFAIVHQVMERSY